MKKRTFSVLIAVMLITLLFSACQKGGEPANSTAPADSATPSESAVSDDSVTFQILFTSDTHGVFDTFNYSTVKEMPGGVTKLATLIKAEKEAFDGTSLTIDLGDAIQGNGTGYFIGNDEYSSFPNIAAFEAIGYDAVVLGNHEFNFGYEALLTAYKGFSGEKLTANVKDASGNYIEGFKAYHVFEVEGGVRVAVIGLVTPNIDKWDPKTMDEAGLTAYDAAEITKEVIAEIKAENLADVIVVAGHMADVNEYGRSGSGATDVAQQNPEIAVFMGAHFHTIIGIADEQHVLEGTDIKFVENINNGGSVGKVQITVVKEGDEWVIKSKDGDYDTSGVKTDVIAVGEDTAIDADVDSVMKPFHDTLFEYVTGTIVGELSGGPLVPEGEIVGEYTAYIQDTPMSDFLLNVVLDASGDDVDIAALAIPDEYAGLDAGDISIAGVSSIYKWADTTMLYKLEMTGTQVKAWMEWAATYFTPLIDEEVNHDAAAFNPETDLTISRGGTRGYNFDIFAGLIYEIDLSKPYGERVNILSMADGSEFDMEKTYICVSNDYRATTQLTTVSPTGVFRDGDKLATIITEEIRNENDNMYMGDFIIDYLAKQPNKTVNNTCDNNWKLVGIDWNEEYRALAVKAINEGLIETDFKKAVTIEEIDALISDGLLNR